jgi:hypothetical protein
MSFAGRTKFWTNFDVFGYECQLKTLNIPTTPNPQIEKLKENKIQQMIKIESEIYHLVAS